MPCAGSILSPCHCKGRLDRRQAGVHQCLRVRVRVRVRVRIRVRVRVRVLKWRPFSPLCVQLQRQSCTVLSTPHAINASTLTVTTTLAAFQLQLV
jgi:hypothetical protein